MDEKTLGLMVMGSLLIAFGALASFMHIRQQEQDARRKGGPGAPPCPTAPQGADPLKTRPPGAGKRKGGF